MNIPHPQNSSEEAPAVYLLETDARLLELLTSFNVPAVPVASLQECQLVMAADRPGCFISNVVLSGGRSGFELLQMMQSQNPNLPTILVSAIPDMSLALRAVEDGAVTMLVSNCDTELLLKAVNRALEQNRERRGISMAQTQILERIRELTDRESQVLQLIFEGHSKNEIARELSVSVRSIEKWRKQGFDRMRVNSPAQLVRILMLAGFHQWPKATS